MIILHTTAHLTAMGKISVE